MTTAISLFATVPLQDLDIKANTLQRHLIEDHNHEGKRLYFVDESSLMGTAELFQFLNTLQKNDRAIFSGDTRQH
ncbi:MAG: AAA family ATPase, partial [Nitrospirota bacterium]|nr:AAA family ATPase [Nitrospirota bacterium]